MAYLTKVGCAAFATAMVNPIIPCALIKTLLDAWQVQSSIQKNIMFRALLNVRPS